MCALCMRLMVMVALLVVWWLWRASVFCHWQTDARVCVWVCAADAFWIDRNRSAHFVRAVYTNKKKISNLNRKKEEEEAQQEADRSFANFNFLPSSAYAVYVYVRLIIFVSFGCFLLISLLLYSFLSFHSFWVFRWFLKFLVPYFEKWCLACCGGASVCLRVCVCMCDHGHETCLHVVEFWWKNFIMVNLSATVVALPYVFPQFFGTRPTGWIFIHIFVPAAG